MKTETFEQAQKINTQIEDLNDAINKIEENKSDCSGSAINLSFCWDEDMDELKQVVLTHLKNKRSKLKKQFSHL